MPGYKLTIQALKEVGQILGYLHTKMDPAKADQTERDLIRAFHLISIGTIPGHRRPDLTTRDTYFHFEPPYFILFRRLKTSVQIQHVVHKSRDVRRIL